MSGYRGDNLEIKLKAEQEEFKKLYSPATAFGNKKLLSKIKILQNLNEEKIAREKCDECNHAGFIEVECDECGGTGVVKIECDHNK